MNDITSAVGWIGGIIAIVTAISSLIYLRRQTILMATQVDKQVEVKITRDLDAPEGVIDSKLRTFLNRRLSDIRTQMRQEFGQRLDEMQRALDDSHITERKDIAEDALRLLSDQRDAVNSFQESNGKVALLERQIHELLQTVDDIRNGVGSQAMVRAQIRGIAEQLLRMTGQDSGPLS